MDSRLEERLASPVDEAALGRELWAAFAAGDTSVAACVAAWGPMMTACPAPTAELAIAFLEQAWAALPELDAQVWPALFDPILSTPGLVEARGVARVCRAGLDYGLARVGLVASGELDASILERLAEVAARDGEVEELAVNARVFGIDVWARALLRAALQELRISPQVAASCSSVASPRERVRLALASDGSALLGPLSAEDIGALRDEAEDLRRPDADVNWALFAFVALTRIDPAAAALFEDLVKPEALARRDPFPEDASQVVLDALAALSPDTRERLLCEAEPIPWLYMVASGTPRVIARAVDSLSSRDALGGGLEGRAIRHLFARWGRAGLAALVTRDATAPVLREVASFVEAWLAHEPRLAPEGAWTEMPAELRDAAREAWAALESEPEGHVGRRFQLPIAAALGAGARFVHDPDELARAIELRPDLGEKLARDGGRIAVAPDRAVLSTARFARTRLLRLIALQAPSLIVARELWGLRHAEREELAGAEDLFHLPSEGERAPGYGRGARLAIAAAWQVARVWTARVPGDERPLRLLEDAERVLAGCAPKEADLREALHDEAYEDGADEVAYAAARSAVYAHDEATQSDLGDEQDTPCDLALISWCDGATWAGATPAARRRSFWTWFLEVALPSSLHE